MKKKLKKIRFRPDFYYESFHDFCLHLDLYPAQIAAYTGLAPATIKRYLKNNTPPPWLLPYLYACCGYTLSPGFDGWRLSEGNVYTPGLRYPLTASQVESYTWHLDVLHVTQSHAQALERKLEAQKNRTSAAIIKFPK